MKIIDIRTEQEFENVMKHIKEYDGEVTIRLKRNIDLASVDHSLFPVDASGINVNIYGNNFSLLNLYLDIKTNNVGLFSKVKNLNVKDLDINGFSIVGSGIVGSLAGLVEKDFLARNLVISSSVLGGNIVGGVVGEVKEYAVIHKSKINASVSGSCIVGGIVGKTRFKEIDDFTIKNSKNKLHISSKRGQEDNSEETVGQYTLEIKDSPFSFIECIVDNEFEIVVNKVKRIKQRYF